MKTEHNFISKIMTLINSFIPKSEFNEVAKQDSYKHLHKDISYFEQFVSHKDGIGIVDFIYALILSEAEKMNTPELVDNPESFQEYNYLLNDTDSSSVPEKSFSIEQAIKFEARPKVHDHASLMISRYGENMSGGLKRAKYGTLITVYNIPKKLARKFLSEFTKLQGERNDIMLEYSRIDDLVNHPDHPFQLKTCVKSIEKEERYLPGIDKNNVYVLEKEVEGMRIYGHAHGYTHIKGSNLSINIRIEVAGERFQFPTWRNKSYDISKKPNQGKKRDSCLHYYGKKLPKTSALGKPFISPQLVGKEAEYTELCEPANELHPRGNEAIYTDLYLSQLNEMYELTKTFADHMELFLTGDLSSFVMESPMENMQSEQLLGSILRQSAQAKQWQPYIIEVTKDMDTSIETPGAYIDYIEEDNWLTSSILAKHDFVFPIAYGSTKVMLVPTQHFVEYMIQKAKEITKEESAHLND